MYKGVKDGLLTSEFNENGQIFLKKDSSSATAWSCLQNKT